MKIAPQPKPQKEKTKLHPRIPQHLSKAPDLALDAPDLQSFEQEMEKRVNRALTKPAVVEQRVIENPNVK